MAGLSKVEQFLVERKIGGLADSAVFRIHIINLDLCSIRVAVWPSGFVVALGDAILVAAIIDNDMIVFHKRMIRFPVDEMYTVVLPVGSAAVVILPAFGAILPVQQIHRRFALGTLDGIEDGFCYGVQDNLVPVMCW